ncbi:MAG: hypothetical protein OHK0022_21560 [Roseiflexaceae bacterium]
MQSILVLCMLLTGVVLAFRGMLMLAWNIGCGLLQAEGPFSPSGSFIQSVLGFGLLVIGLALAQRF